MQKWPGPLRRVRCRLPAKLSGRSNPFTWHVKRSLHNQNHKSIWSRDDIQENSTYSNFKARNPHLFQRKDQIFPELEANRLQLHTSPPIVYHDLVDVAAKVGRVEERIGYNFKNKMLCIEALKLTSSAIPLYFGGKTYHVDRNNRMALLGDRILTLALCDTWFQTGNPAGMFDVQLTYLS